MTCRQSFHRLHLRVFAMLLALGSSLWLAPSMPQTPQTSEPSEPSQLSQPRQPSDPSHPLQPSQPSLVVLDIDGVIGPAIADYVVRGIARAGERGARAVMLRPGTNLGAATPIALGSGGPPMPGRREAQAPVTSRGEPARASEAKAINDAVAYIRSLAELRGRDADWAELAVRDAASLSASAALARHVVDIVAVDADDLLKQAQGREVKSGDARATLQTEGLRQDVLAQDWRTRLLGVITNPNVALILMMIGVYGLLFELLSPGALVPGTIGAICLLLGLYALSALPLNHAGTGLAVLGLALLVAEAFVPSFGILGIGGLVAFGAGVAILMDTEGMPGFEIYWPLIGGLALAGLGLGLLVAKLAMRSFRHEVRTGEEAMLGARAQVTDWNGLSGHVFVRGERWNAMAPHPLTAGQQVRIVSLDGLTLGVAAEGVEPGETKS